MITTVIVWLVMGAIVNVAVAWGCTILPPRYEPTSPVWSHEGAIRWQTTVRSGFGVTSVSAVPTDDYWGVLPMREPEAAATGAWRIPSWSRTRNVPPQSVMNDPMHPWRIEFGCGWPCRSGQAIAETSGGKNLGWRAVSGRMLDPTPGSLRMLPLHPIWPGFAMNTLFYAGILWLLFVALFTMRRCLRIRRGLCAKCGYDLRASSSGHCPECGAAVRPST